MNVLVCLLVYERVPLARQWLQAWDNAIKYDNVHFAVVQNDTQEEFSRNMQQCINEYNPANHVLRPNKGQDIGAFKSIIRNTVLPAWDVLFWCLDDNLPMRRDFLSYFIEPFKEDDKLGLVGNQWVKGEFYAYSKYEVPDHMRTTCFAIRKDAANRLKFPSRLESKSDCYAFEWADHKMNMTQQVLSMGYKILPVNKDFTKCWTQSNDYVWDIGALNPYKADPRCCVDLWDKYREQFVR